MSLAMAALYGLLTIVGLAGVMVAMALGILGIAFLIRSLAILLEKAGVGFKTSMNLSAVIVLVTLLWGIATLIIYTG